ncbi:hypothetical protein [Sodalis sp. RH19]|uniref:hypothetical protein n=1 Tax=Sodalis sp. RH19 TaxID=3394334 RepID=UPI0039B3EFAC
MAFKKGKAYGHVARIVPAQFLNPFVKSNKTDIVDAEAIAEAISRATVRFVALKTEAQLDLKSFIGFGNVRFYIKYLL